MRCRSHTFMAVLLLATVVYSQAAQAKQWAFEVWLDQQKIGTHTFELSQNRLLSRANFKVKILFINAYNYLHRADEQWDQGCLAQLTAHTEENKEITDVVGKREATQFSIEKNKSRQASLPGCVMTFAYWNPEILKQTRLLNPQNAEYLDVTVVDEGNRPLVVKGQTIDTHQYRLTGRYQGKDKLKITLWYDQNQDWVALESITSEGYKVIYKLF